MRPALLYLLISLTLTTYAQQQHLSIFDGRSWGVVLQHPETGRVEVKANVPYLVDAKSTLKLDVYLPPGVKPGDRLPAVVFLNAVGDGNRHMRVKDWAIYRSIARKAAMTLRLFFLNE